MRIAYFTHSLMSDWNHGNAHFLRGVTAELLARGHQVSVFEPADAWSRANLVVDQGPEAVAEVYRTFPRLRSTIFDPRTVAVPALVEGMDLVIVHEWNDPALVAELGRARQQAGYRLVFHDTHHRAATAPEEMARYDLSHYDGVLAFGAVVAELYRDRGWAKQAWIWHEAADVRLFRPRPGVPRRGDLVWIGNWGDGERSRELLEFLVEPVRRLGLTATVHGVRYPDDALAALASAGIRYGGYRPNHRAPATFAAHGVTVHVPRRPYVEALPGIPTIRPFEAMACGIPLVCAPWDDVEGLFRPGKDYLVARSGVEMRTCLDDVLHDPELAGSLVTSGLETILARHTCAHRVDELVALCGAELGLGLAEP
jgi:spore maturation protein CgeB